MGFVVILITHVCDHLMGKKGCYGFRCYITRV